MGRAGKEPARGPEREKERWDCNRQNKNDDDADFGGGGCNINFGNDGGTEDVHDGRDDAIKETAVDDAVKVGEDTLMDNVADQ